MPNIIRPITHIITGTSPVNPWPPTGNYTLCARLYTNTFLDHITLNTVSWNYDSRSSGTYSDPNCNNYLSDLSSWNDYSPNTVLQTTGQNEYGTYVDIFTNSDNQGEENAVDFCVILGNDRVETIIDDSWKITRVEVYKVGMNNGVYRVNNNPSKGQWFRGNNWTDFPITPQASIIFRPLTIFEYMPDPPAPSFPSVQIGNQIWMTENLQINDGGEGIAKVDSVISNGYELGPQTYYTYDAAVRVANTINGWHLPTREEWQTLIQLRNGNNTGVKSTYSWNNDNNGTNLTGLNILPVGRINPYNTTVSTVGSEANIWSSTNISDTNAYATFIYDFTTNWNDGLTSRDKQYKNSVRLIKD